jgi:type II secretory ATPase GspE/PulE/Tfp pilus assembly ATPase PilB-like protein
VICPHCKTGAGHALAPDGELIETFRGAGCTECGERGYVSRMGIFEMMPVTDEMRKLIMSNADASVLTQAARRNGMRNLREDGWIKVRDGVSTAQEVLRVTQEF